MSCEYSNQPPSNQTPSYHVMPIAPDTDADRTTPEQNGESMGLDGDGHLDQLGLVDISIAKSLRNLPGLSPQKKPRQQPATMTTLGPRKVGTMKHILHSRTKGPSILSISQLEEPRQEFSKSIASLMRSRLASTDGPRRPPR